ncbi:Rossmann-fold superfamily protein [Perilla frutescens var. hirtella]|uniref:Rossmann-fold superfamily protein n=1 Tax=Perilla frutescens var. hirtella TaxID=608512 RepID=A0AAD4JQ83_PERFH|nr:Rossmann-fold superfamily protein [Perilla frutescens var. hirtella]
MAEASVTASNRYALVTGGNKGIGFEICRQLASKGVMVILTSRNEKRGSEAAERLKELGLSDYVAFHQLDVVDVASIAAAAQFVKTKYGSLHILVNNAGAAGIGLEGDASIIQELVQGDAASVFADGQPEAVQLKASGTFIQTYKGAEECVETNYYGAKRVTEAFIPLLQLSASPRIVNVSSILGSLRLLQHEGAKSVLSDEASLIEERIDEVVKEFLKNFQEGRLEENEWPSHVAAYKVSKAALTAYTRVIAKKHASFCINSLCPGFARTDITCNLGPLSAAEAAENVVRLALLPDGGPSGAFFYNKDAYSS